MALMTCKKCGRQYLRRRLPGLRFPTPSPILPTRPTRPFRPFCPFRPFPFRNLKSQISNLQSTPCRH